MYLHLLFSVCRSVRYHVSLTFELGDPSYSPLNIWSPKCGNPNDSKSPTGQKFKQTSIQRRLHTNWTSKKMETVGIRRLWFLVWKNAAELKRWREEGGVKKLAFPSVASTGSISTMGAAFKPTVLPFPWSLLHCRRTVKISGMGPLFMTSTKNKVFGLSPPEHVSRKIHHCTFRSQKLDSNLWTTFFTQKFLFIQPNFRTTFFVTAQTIIIIIVIFVFQISGCQTAPWFTMCALRPP